ncbi:MAG: GAF domain-containing protein [Candidatus Omnitrophica bacterium]|nr:GAF domain-containing protein [Candidatus Omnitrophota bacterium]
MIHKVLTVDSVVTSQGYVIRLRGDLFASTVPHLARTVDSLKGLSLSRIVLDLEGLVHIDSRGIGALVGWHRHFTNRGIKFEITQVPDTVLQPLRVCHLDSILEIGPEAALTADKVRLQREALWKSYEFASQILSGLGEGLIAVNTDTQIVYLNPTAEEILNEIEERVIGQPLLESIEILNFTHHEFLQFLQVDRMTDQDARSRMHREIELRKADGERVWVRVIFTPIFRSGVRQGTILNLIDISDEIHARSAGIRHLSHLESLRKVSKSLRTGLDMEEMMNSALLTVKDIFGCDRAWLLYPCDPKSSTWSIQIEVTNPEFPGAQALGGEFEISSAIQSELAKHLSSEDPVVYDDRRPFPHTDEFLNTFQIQSQMAIAIHPHLGKPWLFGIHQCRGTRTWTPTEQSLFKEISFKIADALNSLLLSRGSRAKEESLRSVLEITGGIPEQEFFANMIQYVCQRLDVRHGFIGCLTGEGTVSTLAAWRDGHAGKNFQYAIEGTPCETVIGNKFQHYHGDVPSQFPEDGNLSLMNIHCYMGAPLFSSSGKPLGIIAVLNECEKEQLLDARTILEVMAERVSSVIERQHSREALERSELENRAILSAIPDPIVRLSLEGGVLDVQFPSKEADADPLLVDRCRPLRDNEAIWNEILNLVGECSRKQETRTMEFHFVDSNRVRDYEARAAPYFQNEAIVLFRDISERKMSEAVTKAEKTLLEQVSVGENLGKILDQLVMEAERLVPGMAGSILTLDSEGKRLFHASAPNLPQEYRQAIDGVEIGPDVGSCGTAAFRGEPVFVTNIDDDPLWSDYKSLALEHGLKSCWSIPIFSSSRDVLGTFALYYSEYGAPDRFQIHLIDQFSRLAALAIERKRADDERLRMEQQFQQTQKLESLGILAGGIAHDFNNLLVGILGNAGLAIGDLDSNHPVRETLEQIELSATRASDLTRQLLAYSGRGKFVVEPVNPKTLIEEMAHLLRVSVHKNTTMELEFQPETPNIEADVTQLRQVIMNLMINASDSLGGKAGTIAVRTGGVQLKKKDMVGMIPAEELPSGKYCLLEVRDTGSGMDQATLSRIFDPFFTTKFTGRGLGLAAVLGIVRSHRGGLKVKSEVGKGTHFSLYFPSTDLGKIHSPDPSAGEFADEDLSGTKVLVVDDEDSVRTLVARVLTREGLEVITAESGMAAIEIVQRFPNDFDLVLLDLTMPQLDGKETFDRLVRIQPNLRVLLTSGFSEEETTDRFQGRQLAGFIQKPYRSNELSRRVRSALARPAMEN